MKKIIFTAATLLIIIAATSCDKSKKCVCFAISNGKIVGQSAGTTKGAECKSLNSTTTDVGFVAKLECIEE
jgi:hypothetical protein